eukprot:6181360-Pleurochrysis_carterae.AAC.2
MLPKLASPLFGRAYYSAHARSRQAAVNVVKDQGQGGYPTGCGLLSDGFWALTYRLAHISSCYKYFCAYGSIRNDFKRHAKVVLGASAGIIFPSTSLPYLILALYSGRLCTSCHSMWPRMADVFGLSLLIQILHINDSCTTEQTQSLVNSPGIEISIFICVHPYNTAGAQALRLSSASVPQSSTLQVDCIVCAFVRSTKVGARFETYYVVDLV